MDNICLFLRGHILQTEKTNVTIGIFERGFLIEYIISTFITRIVDVVLIANAELFINCSDIGSVCGCSVDKNNFAVLWVRNRENVYNEI